MGQVKTRQERRQRIHMRVRRKLTGTPERPRLVVYRSLNHVYAQLVDDVNRLTLTAASTLEEMLRGPLGHCGNKAAARAVGQAIAARAKEKGLTTVVFDRAGFRYHGVVKELADAAREAGLEF
jgi:large subunit ribosomal protein L18